MERTPLTLDELKKVSLDILLHIDAFCRERDIPYYLAYGTALGAVRHGGFIPWDDDIDLIMRREDYERFLGEFSDPTGRYICLSFEQGTYPFPFAKIVDSYTEQFTGNMKPIEGQGVGVDIFPLDTMAGDLATVLRKKRRASRQLRGLRYSLYNCMAELNEDHPRPLHSAFYLFCKMWGTRRFSKALSRTILRLRSEHGEYLTLCASIGCEQYHAYPKALFEERAEYTFEGHKFYSFANMHDFLCIAYGEDYMTPPPPEKRTAHLAETYYKVGHSPDGRE